MATNPTVGVVIVTHQSAGFISDTLRALRDDPSGPDDIVVVDNASSDGTPDVVESLGVRCHRSGRNGGYGFAVDIGVGSLDTDVVVALNPDVVVEPGWLPPLVAALAAGDVGAAVPTIELADRPGHFNTSGGEMTVTGVAWVGDYRRPVPDEEALVDITFPSGAACAMRREVWDEIGGMWPDLFLYHEDTDLGWRLRLHGYRSVRVPASRVAHDYEFARTADKLGLLERNRWMLLLTDYRRSTLLLLAPVLAMQELGTLWVAARGGWLRRKFGTWRDVWRRRRSLRSRYRSIQSSRVVGDAAVLDAFDGRLASIDIPGVPVPRGTRLVDRLSGLWVRLVRPLVAGIDRRRGLRV